LVTVYIKAYFGLYNPNTSKLCSDYIIWKPMSIFVEK